MPKPADGNHIPGVTGQHAALSSWILQQRCSTNSWLSCINTKRSQYEAQQYHWKSNPRVGTGACLRTCSGASWKLRIPSAAREAGKGSSITARSGGGAGKFSFLRGNIWYVLAHEKSAARHDTRKPAERTRQAKTAE